MPMKSTLTKGFGRALAITVFAATSPAYATITFTASGDSSSGVPVSFKASLAISGNTLTVQLFNTSTQSKAPNGLLSSFFFDVVKGVNTRPTLTYVSAVGDVYLTSKLNPDTLQTANKNLIALNSNDDTWQYRSLTATSNPYYGFGIGTVGNNDFGGNGFSGNIVGGMDYSIYAGDVDTQNLSGPDGCYLVKGKATFTFSGVSGFTESDIAHKATFGLGTAPDSLLPGVSTVPEPTTMLAGVLLLLPFGASTLRKLRKDRAA
jgi:hypothetical protein